MEVTEASLLLRRRLCDPSYIHSIFKSSPDGNYSKLKFIISNSINEACNNSVLLLGPRGNGKSAVLELVLADLKVEHPGIISVVKLNGLLHGDNNNGLKEIARQLCLEFDLPFSKMASSDENSELLIDILRECGLAHKTVIFTLEEFDLFTQGKQRVLYSLLDALQFLTSQAVVIGLSCRLDADQLLEKRVRSRFSHRKLLFITPLKDDMQRLLEHLLLLPKETNLSSIYVVEFNSRLYKILDSKEFKYHLKKVIDIDNNISNLVMFLYRAVCSMDLKSGFLSLENFKKAISYFHPYPKQESLRNSSILEFYILVCMNRLDAKEQISFNFNSIMNEYKAIMDAYKTSDNYTRNVCLRAFEHLLERGLIMLTDNNVRCQSIEFRPVKSLISPQELHQALKAYNPCPVLLLKSFNNECFK
ncbi:Origin recognition complex subunit 4 [Zostera marina]|uniref:Origin of replication complex subunit 4 n=1 Tax=Zostera marina TaxID=29655 RepID=A0A0K9NRQ9_ZOSMR|nr:Origin recognition complex subunit 4 [Zostera marina]